MEVCLILWLLCSVLCYQIMKGKGYPNDVCLKHGIGGFFLGFIWLIVVLCKSNFAPAQDASGLQASGQMPNGSTYSGQNTADELRKYKELLDDGVITEAEFQAKKEQLLKSM